MSELQNKSTILQASAQELHNKCYYPPVAHCAYYSCYQMMKHIWLYTMNKSQRDLDSLCNNSRMGSHEVLINEIGSYIKRSNKKDANIDSRDFNNKITQLKRLRTTADYDDAVFDISKSVNSLSLSSDIVPILKKH